MRQIGFMQGRLSPLVEGKIQAFPWGHWRDEFEIASHHGFALMEWTLDQDRLCENPLMTTQGRDEIRKLMRAFKMDIASLTGDFFMQEPFFKVSGEKQEKLLEDLKNVICASAEAGITNIVIPLVDNGSLGNKHQEDIFCKKITGFIPVLEEKRIKISFESDYSPMHLAEFINRFSSRHFGINYDTGNSAALGFNPKEEISAYGQRITGVHVKDRVLGGATVPLGTGDTNFIDVITALFEQEYEGDFILQTARANDQDHTGALCKYRDMLENWLMEVKV